MLKKHALINGLMVIVILLAGVGLGYGLSKMAAARRRAERVKAFMPEPDKKSDNRTLREKAKEAKRYSGYKGPTKLNAFADLTGLVEASSAVIAGIPQDNATALSEDGRTITIDYKVKVMYSYKGTLREGNTITVSLPGGMMAFEDGSTAEIRTPWFKKMMNGKAYVLFLTQTSRANQFVTTGEAQGLFEVPAKTEDEMIVQSHTGLPNDAMAKYNSWDARDFFKELRKLTRKPLKSKA